MIRDAHRRAAVRSAGCLLLGMVVALPLPVHAQGASPSPGTGAGMSGRVTTGIGDEASLHDPGAETTPSASLLGGRSVTLVVTGGADGLEPAESRLVEAATRDLVAMGGVADPCPAMDAMAAAACVRAAIDADHAGAIIARASGGADLEALDGAVAEAVAAGMPVVDATGDALSATGVVHVVVSASAVPGAAADAVADRIAISFPGDDGVVILHGPGQDAGDLDAMVAALADRLPTVTRVLVAAVPTLGLPDLGLDETRHVVLALDATAVTAVASSLGSGSALVAVADGSMVAERTDGPATVDEVGVDAAQRGEVAAQVIGRLAGGHDVAMAIELPLSVRMAEAPADRPALARQIGPNGEVSLQMALQAWVDAFGPLPGLDLVPAHTGDDAVEPSMAIRWILRHRAALTDEQRAAVEEALYPEAQRILVDPAGGPGRMVSDAEFRAMVGLSPRAGTPGAGFALAGPLTAQAGLTGNDRLIDDARREVMLALAEHGIGLSDDRPLLLRAATEASPLPRLAESEPVLVEDGDRPTACEVTVFPVALGDPVALRSTVAHELWHCMQYLLAPAYEVGVADWIMEGQATWVSVNLFPDITSTDRSLRRRAAYLTTPGAVLFSRDYDAVGFFSQLEAVGRDPYQFMLAMVTTDNRAAYDVATQGWKAFRETSGSSHFRSPEWGPAWESGGNSLPSIGAGPRPQHIRIGPGDQRPVSAVPYADAVALLQVHAPVTRVTATGDVRMGDTGFGGTLDEPGIATAWLCSPAESARTGCVCHHDEAVDEAPYQVGDAVAFGLTGHVAGARVTFKGYSYEDYCAAIDEQGVDLTACDLLFESDVSPMVEGLSMAPWSSMGMGVGLRPGMSECGFHSTLDDIEGRIAEGLQDCFSAPDPDQCSDEVMARYTGTYRDIQVVLLTSEQPLGELLSRVDPSPIPQLGPQAELVVDSFLPERSGTGFDSSAEAIEFPCGRRSCLVYGVAVDTPPAGSRDRLGLEMLTLATTIQERARKLPPSRAIVRRP